MPRKSRQLRSTFEYHISDDKAASCTNGCTRPPCCMRAGYPISFNHARMGRWRRWKVFVQAAFRRALEEQEEQAEEAAVRLGFLRHVPTPFLDVRFDRLICRRVCLLVLAARFWRPVFLGADVVAEVCFVACPEAGDEVVEGPDFWRLPRIESADAGVDWMRFELAAQTMKLVTRRKIMSRQEMRRPDGG